MISRGPHIIINKHIWNPQRDNPSSMQKYQWQCGPQNHTLSIELIGGSGVKLASGHEDNLNYQTKGNQAHFVAR